MVDQQTAAFLRSDLSDPSQDVLDSVLARTIMVTLKELVFHEGRGTFQDVLKITSPEAVARLRSVLRLRAEPMGHLMTHESHQLECHAGKESLATILLIGPSVVRWPNRWKSDAVFADSDAVAAFFLSEGYARFREQLDEARVKAERRMREVAAWAHTWNAATPDGLADLVPELSFERYAPTSPSRDQALRALAVAYPSTDAQILALFRWYGHSRGPWSGYPSEESVPEYLLEAFPHDRVAAVAGRADLTENQLEGAARFLCHRVYDPVRKRPRKRQAIPAHVRERLWTYMKSTADADKIRRAEGILGPHATG
jgi:hypothetical protein